MFRCRRCCTSFFFTVLVVLGGYLADTAFCDEAPVNWRAQLERDIEKIRSDANLPSIGFSLVIGNTPILTGAVGQANIENNVSASADTPYLQASVSKTFVATALMQMIEAGVISSLHDPVNDHLPWTLENPRSNNNKEEQPIRIAHVVTHTSSIRDEWIWGNGPGSPGGLYFPGDSPISLDEIMRGYFLPGGKWYNASGNFEIWRPGQKYEYANLNGDLVGYLVETATGGVQLSDYSQNNLFQPLGMTNSGWRLADFFDPARVAMPYNGSNNNKMPYGQFGYPDYPCGMLRCSPADMAEYMAVMLGGGTSRNGVQVLQPLSVNMSFTDVFHNVRPGQGVFWYSRNKYGEPDIGHSGLDYGANTEMWLLLNSRVGVAAMINQDDDGGNDAVDGEDHRPIKEVLNLLVRAGRQVAQKMGACCHPDGNCVTQTREDCNAESGNYYQGNRVDCGATNCPTTYQQTAVGA